MSTNEPAYDGIRDGTNSVRVGAQTNEQEDRTAVFSYGYYPQFEFEVIGHLEQRATVDLLVVDTETVSAISRPDVWRGHIIRYDRNPTGFTTFLFARDRRLTIGTTGSLATDSSMYSPELNLLETRIEDLQAPDDEEPEENDEEPEENDVDEEPAENDEPENDEENGLQIDFEVANDEDDENDE